MTGRADPLAVMRNLCALAGGSMAETDYAAFVQAIADVAALVEAAREVAQADRDGALTDVLIDRLDAALAAFGVKP